MSQRKLRQGSETFCSLGQLYLHATIQRSLLFSAGDLLRCRLRSSFGGRQDGLQERQVGCLGPRLGQVRCQSL